MLEDIIISLTIIILIISLIISLIICTIIILLNVIKAEPEQVLELSACWRRCLPALKLPFVLRLLLPAIVMLNLMIH